MTIPFNVFSANTPQLKAEIEKNLESSIKMHSKFKNTLSPPCYYSSADPSLFLEATKNYSINLVFSSNYETEKKLWDPFLSFRPMGDSAFFYLADEKATEETLKVTIHFLLTVAAIKLNLMVNKNEEPTPPPNKDLPPLPLYNVKNPLQQLKIDLLNELCIVSLCSEKIKNNIEALLSTLTPKGQEHLALEVQKYCALNREVISRSAEKIKAMTL